jgi:hypothetical protein
MEIRTDVVEVPQPPVMENRVVLSLTQDEAQALRSLIGGLDVEYQGPIRDIYNGLCRHTQNRAGARYFANGEQVYNVTVELP